MKCPICKVKTYHCYEENKNFEKGTVRREHVCFTDRCDYIIKEAGYVCIRWYKKDTDEIIWRQYSRILVEKFLTKKFGIRVALNPTVDVHHNNGRTFENIISNLALIGRSDHKRYHSQYYKLAPQQRKQLLNKYVIKLIDGRNNRPNGFIKNSLLPSTRLSGE